MKLSVVVLTKNEEIHLERCLSNLEPLQASVLVVDSLSCDNTEAIAKRHGASFVANKFVNHSQQFNFALSLLSADVQWVLRIDADEFLTDELIKSIQGAIQGHSPYVGYHLKRRMTFGRRIMRHGGIFPTEVVRLFRRGKGMCEERWMDEHVIVDGPLGTLDGELIDDNLKSLTWWVQKHNLYSNREAVEVLRLKYGRKSSERSITGFAGFKRFIKEHIYAKLPVFPKVLAYFMYRYIIRLGFLDGREGLAFHFLQGFWYRYLVEAKVQEVERWMKRRGVVLHKAIEDVLEIKI